MSRARYLITMTDWQRRLVVAHNQKRIKIVRQHPDFVRRRHKRRIVAKLMAKNAERGGKGITYVMFNNIPLERFARWPRSKSRAYP